MDPKPERYARGGDSFEIKTLLWFYVRGIRPSNDETTNTFDTPVDNTDIVHIL